MLRALLAFAFPISLLASVAPVGAPRPWSQEAAPLALQSVRVVVEPTQAARNELERTRAAAAQGDAEAQTRLGSLYYWGQEGVDKDLEMARTWLGKAAEQGQRDAQAKLGAMYFLGQGGPKDMRMALKWFAAAAEQGEPYAQGCLGVLYAVGEGVRQDLKEAYYWLLQANAGGDADAAEPLQQVKSRLTPEQIQESFRRAYEALRKRASN
jgi:hypothetical protein